MSRERRIEILKAIEAQRGTKVISYITSDRHNAHAMIAGDAVRILHKHILEIEENDRSKLDLLIYSRGGHSDVPWTIVSMFREYCKEGAFSVLIPFKAHSAATVLAIGADQIIMTKKAELGPIDITMAGGPYNPKDTDSRQRLPVSVEDVMGYFSILEKIGCERPDEIMEGFLQLTKEVHPLAIGKVSRLLEQTELVALRLLGTRAKPFGEEKNKEIAHRLSSEIYSHNHTISRKEAIENLGLQQIEIAEKAKIDEELWEMFEQYNEFFKLEDPFKPEEEMVLADEDEKTWENIRLACIESVNRLDVCRESRTYRKMRQVPPEVTINLNQIAFPQVTLPELPEGLSPQDVMALVETTVRGIVAPVIEEAARNAATQFLMGLPTVGFEHISFNGGWYQDED